MICACPCCRDAARYHAIRPHLKVLNLDAARWLLWMPETPAPAPFPRPATIDEALEKPQR